MKMKIRTVAVFATAALVMSATATAGFQSLTGSSNQFDYQPKHPFTGAGGGQSQPLNSHLILYDISRDGIPTWNELLAAHGQIAVTGWHFDLDPWYGIQGFDGPLTSFGAGPVSPGVVGIDVAMEGQTTPNDLVAVGPDAGFGNMSNAVLANFFVDSLEIHLNWDGQYGSKTAVEFQALSLLGSDTVDVYVDGVFLANVDAPEIGHRWGILDTSGAGFTHIELRDPADGAQGVSAYGIVYIPAPGAIALLGLAGLVARRRRR